LIEATLSVAQVPVNDMTRLQEDGRRIVTVAPSGSCVNLYKLHGSIDWFRWRPEEEHDGFWGEWVGYAPSTKHRSPWTNEGRPIILVGRFNKELSYASSPFAELFAAARASLNSVTRLVVSGYSFGDKAVNTLLIEWLHSAPKRDRRLIVAHADCTGLRDGARGAIGNKWDSWIEAGVLNEIPKFLGDLSWPDLSDRMDA
jgi:SIR2-like domain